MMNKRQLELQNQLYSLFEEERHPIFITNLLEKLELGVIYGDLSEEQKNEVLNNFKNMHDLNENFFKDLKGKVSLDYERIKRGVYVQEIVHGAGTSYKKVNKDDADYILKGRKLYTLEGEFVKQISPQVYKQVFPELSEKEPEIRIKDKKENLRESHDLEKGGE